MEDIPLVLLEGLSPTAVAEVRAWWSSLSDSARHDIAFLWDARQDLCFFPPERDDSGEWQWSCVPIVIGSRFLPPEDEPGWEEWRVEYLDYSICNPELGFYEPLPWRIFYIGGKVAATGNYQRTSSV